jgi:hypothetical protein
MDDNCHEFTICSNMLDGFPKNDLRFLAKMRKEIPARKTGFPVPGQALIRANGHPH